MRNNPFRGEVKLSISAMAPEKITLSLTDESGRIVATQNNSLASGVNEISINNSLYLANGVYMLRINSNTETKTIKLLKGQ